MASACTELSVASKRKAAASAPGGSGTKSVGATAAPFVKPAGATQAERSGGGRSCSGAEMTAAAAAGATPEPEPEPEPAASGAGAALRLQPSAKRPERARRSSVFFTGGRVGE